jgi:DNA polymerase-3 subunit delta'
MEGRQKVYILDPANRPGLQEDAGNALLLTVEEPPAHVVIILISSRPSAVLPTLVSRCRPIRFHLAPREMILRALTELGTVSPAQATAITGMADGRIGWAVACASNPRLLEIRQALLTEIDRLLPSGRPAALRLAELLHALAAATDDEKDETKSRDRVVRRNLPDLLDVVASWWRDLLIAEVGERAMRINVDFADALDRHAGHRGVDRLRHGLRAIVETKRLLERNANIDLALEQMWIAVLAQ